MKYIVKMKKEAEKVVVIEASSDEEADRMLLEEKYKFSAERAGEYEYISHSTSNTVFTSEQDLKDYYGTDNIARMLFKYTNCGCSYYATETYVNVAGYAENSGDAECPGHILYFPFSLEEWDAAVSTADQEGCDLWNEYNEDGWDDEEWGEEINYF